MSYRIGERLNSSEALQSIWKERNVGIEEKFGMHNGVGAHLVMLYGCERWLLNAREKQRVYVMKVKFLESICNRR